MMATGGNTVPLFPNRPRELLYCRCYRSFNTRPAQHRLRDELRAEADRPTGYALAPVHPSGLGLSFCTDPDKRFHTESGCAAQFASRAGRLPRRRRPVEDHKPMTQREHPEHSSQRRAPSSTESAARMTPVRRGAASDAGLSAAARTGQSRSSPNNAVRRGPIGTRPSSGALVISLPSDAEASLSSRLAGCGLGPRPATTRAQRDHTMDDRPTPALEIGDEQRGIRFDRDLTAFDSVCTPAVKSKSQHSEGICTDLTDLTGFLLGGVRDSPARARSRPLAGGIPHPRESRSNRANSRLSNCRPAISVLPDEVKPGQPEGKQRSNAGWSA
jgi:hypothetical protein